MLAKIVKNGTGRVTAGIAPVAYENSFFFVWHEAVPNPLRHLQHVLLAFEDVIIININTCKEYRAITFFPVYFSIVRLAVLSCRNGNDLNGWLRVTPREAGWFNTVESKPLSIAIVRLNPSGTSDQFMCGCRPSQTSDYCVEKLANSLLSEAINILWKFY